MTELLFHTAEIFFALFVILLPASVVTAWCFVWINKSGRIAGDAAKRSSLLLILGLLTPVITLWSVIFLYIPGLSAFVVPAHCHQEICSAHKPALLHSLLATSLLSLAVALSLCLFAGLFLQLQLHKKRMRVLSRLALMSREESFYILDSHLLFAMCSGLWQTKIFVSKGLYEVLSPEEIEVVISHERAHAQRLDNFKKILLFCATAFWPKKIRATLLNEFELACEQACDQLAVKQHGFRIVECTLKKLTSLWSGNDTTGDASGIGLLAKEDLRNDVLIARLSGLQQCDSHETNKRLWWIFLSLGLVLVPLLGSSYHMLAEWVLGVF